MSKELKLFIGMLVLVTLLIFGAGLLVASKSASPLLVKNQKAKIEVVTEKNYDWGNIDINGGKVDRHFQIKNVGEADLEVADFKTSCMCTIVKISINGQLSPEFGMHSQSNWKGALKPGDEADVTVVFDPLFHGPQALGPITRLVSFSTNDPKNPNIEFRLVGNVINKNE